VHPEIAPNEPNGAIKFCEEVFPVLSALVEKFINVESIVETVCKCWREIIFAHRTATGPMLPELANKLVSGFQTSSQGSFLWASTAIVRTFNDTVEGVDQTVLQAVFQFFEQQTKAFLRILSETQPEEVPTGKDNPIRYLLVSTNVRN
jgi:transportin-3